MNKCRPSHSLQIKVCFHANQAPTVHERVKSDNPEHQSITPINNSSILVWVWSKMGYEYCLHPASDCQSECRPTFITRY